MTFKDFAKGVERLVAPVSVGTIHFMQGFMNLLPISVQNKLMENTSKSVPRMGFVVEPYSFFIFYEITDIKAAQKLLPEHFVVEKTAVFDSDEPKYYCILGVFKAHTSAFWGTRLEFYVVSRDTRSNLLTWSIIDYDTNSISHDKKYGLRSPTSSDAVLTINHQGVLYGDIRRDDSSRQLVFDANVTAGRMKNLDQRLWLEGNLSVGYGAELSDNSSDTFSLKFHPEEVERALEIPRSSFTLEENTWYREILAETPTHLVCFPYAQHFLSDSPGVTSSLKTRDELERAVNSVDFKRIPKFETSYFKPMILGGMVLSFVITIVLITLLLLR